MIKEGCEGMYELIDNTGKRVAKGARLTDFRGDTHVLKDGLPPHKPDSEGFIVTDQTGLRGRLYAGVCNLKWRLIA